MAEVSKYKYKLPDDSELIAKHGQYLPMFEADYDHSFIVRKTDRRGAIIGDPRNCIEAKALCRLPGVLEAYIGAGKDAYVAFEATSSRPYVHVLHFTIPANSAKVRDAFDTKRGVTSQVLMLRAPTKGRTLQHRRALDKARRQAIKEGAAVKKRTKAVRTRIHRLGVALRPRAHLKEGIVSLDLGL